MTLTSNNKIPSTSLERNSKVEPSINGQAPAKTQEHFNGWPNAAGFNASAQAREKIEIPSHGQFPPWAAGSLYRTGPGMHKLSMDNGKEFACSHWFDGFTTTYKFDIVPTSTNETKVFLTARQQEDVLIEQARKSGKLAGISFGQKRDPCDTFWKKIKQTFEPQMIKDAENTNVGVVLYPVTGDSTKMLATTDSVARKTFDAETLEPLGVTDQKSLHPSLKGPLSGAHAQIDPVTGDIFNYNLDFGPSATYRLFRTSASTGQTEILATVPGMKGAYIHSMFLTESFAILCIWPEFFNGYGISILKERNLLDAMSFDPRAECTWLVVDRHRQRGLVKRFKSPAMFSFHSINSWEEKRGDGNVDVFCELYKFKDSEILHKLYYENMVSDSSKVKKTNKATSHHDLGGALARFKLPNVSLDGKPQSSKTEKTEMIKHIGHDKAGDLPVINPKLATKPHRYVYGVVNRGLSSFIDGLCKTDTAEDSCIYWERPNHTPGEPIFIADPTGDAEDDGILLTVVLDGEKGTSYLLCLSAKDLSEIAWAEWDHAVGFGFHGVHVPAQ